MKYRPIAYIALLLLFTPSGALASGKACAGKEAALLKQIAKQKHATDPSEFKELQRELSYIRTHCTDDKLRAKADTVIAKKQAQLAKRQTNLDQARIGGKPKEILAFEKKLQEAITELEAAKAERSALD